MFEYVERECSGGVQRMFTFNNGYRVSVICHPYSYGGRDGLWELAVIRDGNIVYDTPVTSDVEGHLKWEEVETLLKQVADLPPAHSCQVDGAT